MNKRQKKKYTDRVCSLVAQVSVFTQDGRCHTDLYPEAIRMNAKMFRRCWNWIVKNDIFSTNGHSPRGLNPYFWYNITILHRSGERPCAYWTQWREKNA